MKLWKLTTQTPDCGERWNWFSNCADAKRAAMQHRRDYANDAVLANGWQIECVDFPSGKKALIEWLNANAPDGNG